MLALLLLALIVLASAQIALRNLFDTGLVWGDPLSRMLVLWLGMLGALAATRDDRQITVDVLSRPLRGRARSATRALTSLFAAAVTALLAYHAGRFVAFDREAGVAAVAGLPAWHFELVMPFAFGLIGLRYALRTAAQLRALWRGTEAPGGQSERGANA